MLGTAMTLAAPTSRSAKPPGLRGANVAVHTMVYDVLTEG